MKNLKKILFIAFSVFFLTFPIARASTLIDINSASMKELVALPGIGKKKATSIVEFRSKYGCFVSKGGIKKVKGIGNKLYAKIEEKIEVKKSSSCKK